MVDRPGAILRRVRRLFNSASQRVVDAYDTESLSGRARARRWEVLRREFPRIEEMTVLDLGGDVRAWRQAPVRPAHVTLLNVAPQEVEEPWISALVGDACDPPDLPAADLAYSNSVIEHVGGHQRRKDFAVVVRDAAPAYWVQTPNRYFPIEPHFMFPGLQFAPRGAQASLIRRWPLGNHADVTDHDQALGDALDIELIAHAEMEFYFPDAKILRERFAGLTKSLIAVRS
jgi:hypothetical protein